MTPTALSRFEKRSEFFVGVDSDGCCFDSMEVKHKECFIPNIVRFYGLAAVSKYVREAAEFLNLYSRWRGVNRFPGLPLTVDLLADRPEVRRRGVRLPDLKGLRDWLARESKWGNPTLKAEVERTGDPDLTLALEWSLAVNRSIEETVKEVPPFPMVRETLQWLPRARPDVMVVSATPAEALQREWREHGLDGFVGLIAGQELGSKKEMLGLAAAGKYEPEKVLMIGDAPGDFEAARHHGVLFYPIDPGDEDASWQRLYDEALPLFFAGRYAGDYMAERVAAFDRRLHLRLSPPWK